MRIHPFLFLLASLIAGAMLTAAPAAASTGKRVALVIGNSAYEGAVPLPNPERDAKAVAGKLRKLGFVVVEGYNLGHDGMKETVKDFSTAVRGADIGLFFYAGHGMQVNGHNYLVPVDAAFNDISALDFEAIPMELISKQMQYDVKVRLVVLDACRDNPLAKSLTRSMAGTTRSNAIAEGLAEVKIVDAGEGTAIIFATSPDEVALDGDGEHSPFTAALLDNIDAPDTELQVVMSRVTGAVYASTKQQQRPWINASLTGEIYLNPQAKAAAAANAAPAASSAAQPDNSLERETALYNLARNSGAREDYQAYLETFPNGLYAANARKQLERLDNEAKTPQVAAVAPAQDTAVTPGTEPVRSVAPPVLDLPITDAVRAMPAGREAEDELELDRAKRAEIQTRLKLLGFLKGSADGSFGPKSREAIGAWQQSRGLNRSGFFNQPQYEIFMQQTQTAFAAHQTDEPQPSASSGGRKQEVRQKNSGRKQVARKTERRKAKAGNNAERVGRFLGGVVRGALGN